MTNDYRVRNDNRKTLKHGGTEGAEELKKNLGFSHSAIFGNPGKSGFDFPIIGSPDFPTHYERAPQWGKLRL
jgi:hypothetical protein